MRREFNEDGGVFVFGAIVPIFEAKGGVVGVALGNSGDLEGLVALDGVDDVI